VKANAIEKLEERMERLEQEHGLKDGAEIVSPALQAILDAVDEHYRRDCAAASVDPDVDLSPDGLTVPELIARLVKGIKETGEQLAEEYRKGHDRKTGEVVPPNTPTPNGPDRYRCIKRTTLGSGQWQREWSPGQVWDADQLRRTLYANLEDDPTPQRVDKIMERVFPEPRVGECWEAL
jgi:hypothetical protein